MSMLTTQADELRKAAAAMKELGREIGKPYGMSRGLIRTAQMMREAADTIEGLRDRLQEAGSVDAERDAMFAKAIRRAVEKNTDFGVVDIGESHRQADELLCDLLLSHGYIETVDEFKSMRKWYE